MENAPKNSNINSTVKASTVKDYFQQKIAETLAQKFTQEYLNRNSVMQNFEETGHNLDAEKIDAIKQKNSKGFVVYDIDPNNLDRGTVTLSTTTVNGSTTLTVDTTQIQVGSSVSGSGISAGTSIVRFITATTAQMSLPATNGTVNNRTFSLNNGGFNCVYDYSTILRVLGLDWDYLGTAGTDNLDTIFGISSPTPSRAPVPYWRTVQIGKVGNWMKIEFIESRFNTDSREILYSTPQNVAQSEPQNTNLQQNSWEYSGQVMNTAANNTILLDFENPTPTPIIVKNGQSFETYFSNVILTFKQMNCLIRVTIGYNSKIIDAKEPTPSLSLGTGKTFTSRLDQYTPFSFSDRDFNNSNYYGIQASTSAITYQCLIKNLLVHASFTSYSLNNGVTPIWITGFDALYFDNIGSVDTSGGSQIIWDFELIQARYDSSSGTYQPTTVLKRLCGLTFEALTFATWNQYLKNKSSVAFNEPIRVTLRAGEALYFRATPCFNTGDSFDTGYVKFNVTGYGPSMFQDQNSPSGNYSFTASTWFTEHPFPQDSGTYQLPRR